MEKRNSRREERRERLQEVFADTQQYCQENRTLARAAQKSTEETRFYAAEDYPALPSLTQDQIYLSMLEHLEGDSPSENASIQAIRELQKATVFVPEKEGRVTVTRHRSYEAALLLAQTCPGSRIAVLNFASAVQPGGGVLHGAQAQEEALCRCSTLYPALDSSRMREQYYEVNRREADPLHSDALLWTPGVVICKTDTDFPERLPEESFVTVDVISCAAPDLRGKKDGTEGKRPSGNALFALHKKRAAHILTVAAAEHADHLVLGAFGCGAFGNPPDVVARAWMAALLQYRHRFESIEFAIYCRDHETANYDSFARFLGDM